MADEQWQAPDAAPPAQPDVPAFHPPAPPSPNPQPGAWAPPGAAPAPPQPPGQQPTWQQPGSTMQPGAVGWSAAPGAAPSGEWTPPPKPGLIPLRPLTLGPILAATFQVMRRNPMPTFGFALLLTGAASILALLIVGVVTFIAFDRVERADQEDQETIAAGGVALGVVAVLVAVVLQLLTTALVEGIVSLEVSRGALGERLRFRGLWRRMKGRIGAVIGWVMMIGFGSLVILGVLALLLFGIGSLGDAGIAAAVVLGLLIGPGGVVVAVWLSTKLAMVPAVIVLERRRLFDAVRRSWTLTRGYFWRTFGILLLVSVIYQFASQIVATPFSFVISVLVGLLGTGDTTTLIVVVIVTYALFLLLVLVIGAIGVVMISATVSLLYLDLRMRKEGLDLELIRFVEARAAGDGTVIDPFDAPPGATTAPSGGAEWFDGATAVPAVSPSAPATGTAPMPPPAPRQTAQPAQTAWPPPAPPAAPPPPPAPPAAP